MVAAQPPDSAADPANHAAPTDAEAGERSEARNLRDQEARQLFEAGRIAFSDGRFEDALGSFQRSYELSGRPRLLFNIGASLDRLKRDREALDYFENYLEKVPDADNRREVEGRVRVLQEAVAQEEAREAKQRKRDAALAQATKPQEKPRDGVHRTWWFWTTLGAAVAGGVVLAILLTADGGTEDPLLGNTGQVSFTLGSE